MKNKTKYLTSPQNNFKLKKKNQRSFNRTHRRKTFLSEIRPTTQPVTDTVNKNSLQNWLASGLGLWVPLSQRCFSSGYPPVPWWVWVYQSVDRPLVPDFSLWHLRLQLHRTRLAHTTHAHTKQTHTHMHTHSNIHTQKHTHAHIQTQVHACTHAHRAKWKWQYA